MAIMQTEGRNTSAVSDHAYKAYLKAGKGCEIISMLLSPSHCCKSPRSYIPIGMFGMCSIIARFWLTVEQACVLAEARCQRSSGFYVRALPVSEVVLKLTFYADGHLR